MTGARCDRRWPATNRARLLLALAGGAGLHLAFPWPGWDLLGWIGLAPMLGLAATARSPAAAFWEGWLGGVAFSLLLLRWLAHTMTTFSSLPWPLAILILAALAAYLALYWGAVAALQRRLQETAGVTALWLAPMTWVAGEWVRAQLFTGFPWGLLGYIPYRRVGLIQLAAWTGVYGLSALLVLVNTAVVWAVLRGSSRRAAVSAVVVGLAVGGTLAIGNGAGRDEPTGTVPVAVAQGNLDQAVKSDKAFQQETLRIYAALTREAAAGSRLVVWPEAAVPAYLFLEPWALPRLTALAVETGVPLLVGAPAGWHAGDVTGLTNSAFLVGAEGVRGRYDKMHLVPFGEYVPSKRLLFFVAALAAEIGDFSPGRDRVLFPLGELAFGTVICYEVIFPDLFRRFVADGASFMVNITNDAWFGNSGGPLQHLAMVPFRAVENGVAIVRAANTGVSALVLPSGAIRSSLGLFERGVLRADVPVRSRRTFYTRFGDLFAFACAAMAGAGVVAAVAAGRRG